MTLRLRLVVPAVFAFGVACGNGTPVKATLDAGRAASASCLDSDGDGVAGTGDCAKQGPVDCDDRDSTVFPGAKESCNGVDDDCDGQVDEGVADVTFYEDLDGDGFGARQLSEGCDHVPANAVTAPGDCKDSDPLVHPGASEVCNGLDDDCNGAPDDGLPSRDFSLDRDGDGYGDSAGAAIHSCQSTLAGRVPNALDCDDTRSTVKPGATELCNALDDDCDAQADEGLPQKDYFPDVDGDGFGAASATAQRSCAPVVGKVDNARDCNDSAASAKPGATEVCNAQDDDCDGQIDEGLRFVNYYADVDGDGFGAAGSPAQSWCLPVSGKVADNTDCDDQNVGVKPGALELCNGRDDNCSGAADEGLNAAQYFVDGDGDGFGGGAPETSCTVVAGKVTNGADCDDTRATVKPTAVEVCNAIDDNCNGQKDEGLTFANYFTDSDGDGFGAGSAVSACAAIPGKVTNNTDCDDTKSGVKPGALEVCNGLDDNCSGAPDEGLTFKSYYADTDGDGHGAGPALNRCAQPAGAVLSSDDCNDTAATAYPGAPELCNGADDNCNTTIDDGVVNQNYYADTDQDGFGAGPAQSSCSPVSGRVLNNTDCDDTKSSVKPGATELCNGLDDNCVGGVDEGLNALLYYVDGDADGHGKASASPVSACSAVPGSVTNNTDCDDTKPSVKPNAPELCNGLDDDCDTVPDDGLPTQTFYVDGDLDGYGSGQGLASCQASVTGRVKNNTDCDDGKPAVHPGVTESCNGVDDNCAGGIDEGNPGGGATCTTGQSGVCGKGTMTCQSAALSCKRDQGPTTEKCDGLDNDCNGTTDDTWPTKGSACSMGVGVCLRSGSLVCNGAQTALVCSVTAGSPTAPACDGLDNDCDATTDEPVLSATQDVGTSTAWQDVEVTSVHYTAGSCAGGTTGTGTDALAGGALVMAGGSPGVWWQKLDTQGRPTGSPVDVSSYEYSDVAIAQAGAGTLIAGIWAVNHAEIDLYYVDHATSTHSAHAYTQFKVSSSVVLDSLRVVRGNGGRAIVLWRENGAGIKLARVQPTGCGSGACTGLSVLDPAGVLIAGGATTPPGLGADAAFADWAAVQPCSPSNFVRLLGVSYLSAASTLQFFYVYEDGSGKTAETLVLTESGGRTLAEPEVTHLVDGTAQLQFLTAWVTRDVLGGSADLNFWLSSQVTNPPPYQYGWLSFASLNGADSISRPRASANGSKVLLSATRWVSDFAGQPRQVMTRFIDSTGAKVPGTSAVELSPTSGSCSDTPCRPGDKVGVTNFTAFNHLYFGATGATPTGTYASTLSCN